MIKISNNTCLSKSYVAMYMFIYLHTACKFTLYIQIPAAAVILSAWRVATYDV